jgi:hypothetical protein
MKIIKPGDIIAFLATVGLIVFLSLQIYGDKEEEGFLYVHNGRQEWVYPLDEDQEIAIPGMIGDTIVKIEGGKARVLDSPCPDKICVHAFPLEHSGDWTACLPNQVFLSLTSGGIEELLDDYSY